MVCPKSKYKLWSYFSYLVLSLCSWLPCHYSCVSLVALEDLTLDAPAAWQQPSTRTEHHNPFVHLLVGLVGSSGNMGLCSGCWIKWYGLIKTQNPCPTQISSPLPLHPNDWLWQADLVLARDWWATTRLANHVPMAQQTQPHHYALISYNIAPLCPLKGAEAGGFCPCHK